MIILIKTKKEKFLKKSNTLQKESHTITYKLSWLQQGNTSQSYDWLPMAIPHGANIPCSFNFSTSFYAKQQVGGEVSR